MHETPRTKVIIRVDDTVSVHGQTKTDTYAGVVTSLEPPEVTELVEEGSDRGLSYHGQLTESQL